MKTIKEIANNAGFDCDVDRHGCYTNYVLKSRADYDEYFDGKLFKGQRIIRIEYTAPRKNLRSGYLFMANGPINHNIDGAENFVWEKPAFGIFTHALATNGDWLYLTIEQVETLINNN